MLWEKHPREQGCLSCLVACLVPGVALLMIREQDDCYRREGLCPLQGYGDYFRYSDV